MNKAPSTIAAEPNIRFAWLTFVSLTLCGFVIAILDLLQEFDYVSGLGNSTGSFVVVVFSFTLLMLQLRRTPVSRFLATFVTSLMLAGVLMCLFSLLEDIKVIRNSGFLSAIDFAKKLLVVAWFTTPPAFVAILFRMKEQMRVELEQRVEARTLELSDANARLQQEIRERIQAENELNASQREQNALMDARSEELRNVQKRLLQNERLQALGLMATGLAHELNNTLTPVVSYSELLLRSGELDGKQNDFVAHIARAAKDAAHVVRSLQTFHSSGEKTKDKPVDLNDIVTQVSELTRPIWHNQAIRNGKQVQLQLDLESSRRVWGEESELRQVVTNLILNSYEALSDVGTITVSTRQNENTIELRVSDDGSGMSSEQKQRCFEPFCTGKTNGTGLGLSVCYGIVTRMDGSIQVESSSEQGTVMKIAFPAVTQSSCRVDPAHETVSKRSSSSLRMLLVDDDDNVRDSVSHMLQYMGVDVVCASTGKEALAIAAETSFDLVLSDLGMPDFDGAATIKALRNSGCKAALAIVSGWSEPVVRERFHPDAPPDISLRKPVNMEQLQALVDHTTRAVKQANLVAKMGDN